MIPLPKGYYAVASDFENAPKDTFTYKGVTYAVEVGINLFATPHEADAAAKEIPETVLDGLNYECFEAPVLLFSKGTHDTKRLYLSGSRYLLGQGAGVNPNLPITDVMEGSQLNPERGAEEETVFKGSHVEFKTSRAHIYVIDGVTLYKACIWDGRRKGDVPVFFTCLRNVIYTGPCSGYVHRIFGPDEDSKTHREVLIENCRVKDLDALGGCGCFLWVCGAKVTLDGLYYDTCNHLFGLTDTLYAWSNVAKNTPVTKYTIKNSYFRHIDEENSITIATKEIGKRSVHLNVLNTTFVDASMQGRPVFCPELANDNCIMTVRDSTFIDTRGNDVAIMVKGKGRAIKIENTEFKGFQKEWDALPIVRLHAPDYIKNRKTNWTTATEDPHRVIGTDKADFTALDVRYEGKKAYYGDQHTHTDCGGRSDGTYPMKDWVARMNEIGLDFAFVVDHRQMRGFFLPEWDTDRFVYGTEPGGAITDLKAPRGGASGFHYNMLFKDKYDLALLLANFPEYKFEGDELTGKFGYPKFTRERFDQLVAYIHKLGGMIVHPHPASIMCSDAPEDYSFGEHTYFETLYGTLTSRDSFQNYKVWCRMLDAGLHVYTAGGSDTHAAPSNAVVSTFYCAERTGRAAFDCMKTADYTVGGIGFKMCIDGKPMGSELTYREGMKLTLRVDDYFKPNMKDNTVYELRILTDKGLAYASLFSGKEPQAISLEVQKRRFYRAEVFDLTHGYRVAVGNPIWLDKE